MTDSPALTPIPNVFDLAGDALDEFHVSAETAAQQYRDAGIACTATHAVRAAQFAQLVELAARVRTTGISTTVKRFANNEAACVVLVLGLEALGVDMTAVTPEQAAEFCSRLEVVLSTVDKSRPKFR